MCKGRCVCCGKCCTAIWLPILPIKAMIEANWCISKHGYRSLEHYSHTNDLIFVYMHWTPISVEKAVELNPYIKNWAGGTYLDNPNKYPGHFYTCEFFDKEKKLCKVHGKNQPKICTGYPGYGSTINQRDFYSKECGFAPWNLEG